MPNRTAKMYVNPKEFKKIIDKFEKLKGLEDDLEKELKQTAVTTINKARADFSANAMPYLKRRKEKHSGLLGTIKYRLLKRQKSVNAYSLSSGDAQHPIMAYMEFGTRRRRINLRGIRKIFGGRGVEYAREFKGSDDPRFFSNTSAKPYFYMNVYNEQKEFLKRMKQRIRRLLKQK